MRNGVIASLLVVALIIGIAFGTVIFPRTLTLTSTQTTTVSTVQTTTLFSTTTLSQRTTASVSTTNLTYTFINMTATQCSTSASLPCGMAAYNQGALVITNASLTVSPSNNSTSGVLTLTLIHTEEFEGTALSVSMRPLGGSVFTLIMQTTAIGQAGTYTVSIPASFPLTRGLRYQIVVDSLLVFTGEFSGAMNEELDIALAAN